MSWCEIYANSIFTPVTTLTAFKTLLKVLMGYDVLCANFLSLWFATPFISMIIAQA